MIAEVKSDPMAQEYSGLTRLEPSLPSHWYFDSAQYALELERIWYRNWIYLCRADSIAETGSFRTFTIGTQPLLVLRDEHGTLRAFFNTCRHRGSMLCTEPAGRLAGRAITCPYHAWSYRLSGELARIPNSGRPHHVPLEQTALYSVTLKEWRGFIYVNLAGSDRGLAQNFNANIETVANWPLEQLVVGRRQTQRMRCNWKIFWENYNECLHCPTIHPALSNLVPIYRRGFMEQRDDPNWRSHAQDNDPARRGGLRTGAATWSSDGRALAHEFEGLSDEERRIGYHFVTSLPSHYLVAHVDYVRSSRLLPLGPEETEIEVEWLFPRETLEDSRVDIRSVCDFSAQVLAEDAAACELNQRGLRSSAHAHGMLMPEEYDLFRLHEWLRAQLREPGA
ncbi:MAG TPA: aromatic ring-hydroxylating dioxygenase subunit alpha [Steroidobacteraceae bacterium]|jgi:Rieske 2Fe-2S family protein|nr:aromatic ring-hydroxylating dioxygenase subunit alpha [Steroidobacteraceae bacterium]